MLRTSVVALALSAGVILSGSAFAESPQVRRDLERVVGGQWRPVWQRDQFDPHGPERQRAGRGCWGERVRSGGGERVRQPGSAEERGPRHRVRQAVGFVRLRVVDGVVDGVLGPLDCASRVTAQAN